MQDIVGITYKDADVFDDDTGTLDSTDENIEDIYAHLAVGYANLAAGDANLAAGDANLDDVFTNISLVLKVKPDVETKFFRKVKK